MCRGLTIIHNKYIIDKRFNDFNDHNEVNEAIILLETEINSDPKCCKDANIVLIKDMFFYENTFSVV